MSEWPLIKLGDVIELITGFPFKSKEYSENGEGYKLLRGDNIVQGRFRWEDVKLWPKSKIIDKHENYWLKEGDVILAMDRPWIEAGLKYAQITLADLPCLLVQRTSCLRAKMGFDQNFLRYLISSYYFVEYVKQVQTGTAVPHISGKQILDFEFNLPPIEVQNEIGYLLRSLDNKIELNRHINQTLEQIAQAIFKSWFVDFEPVKAKIEAKQNGQDPERAAMRAISGKTDEELDALSPEQRQQLTTTAALFPDELEDSELGEIPKGWIVDSMKDLSEKITKGTTPRKPDILNAEDPAVIPFIKVKDITDDGEIIRGGLESIPASIHENALKRSILKTDDLLFSIAGTIGRVSIVESDLGNSNTNQAVAFIRLKDHQEHLELCHQAIKSRRTQDEIASKVVQGVQANASLANIGDIKVIVPSQAVLDIWNQTIKPISTERRNISGQIRTLSQVRDSLLPKLLSGEITLGVTQSTSEAVA